MAGVLPLRRRQLGASETQRERETDLPSRRQKVWPPLPPRTLAPWAGAPLHADAL